MRTLLMIVAPLACLAAVAGRASADSVSVEASRDNSMFSESDDLSNGAGIYLFAGQTRSPSTFRRALVRFDVEGVLPAEATATGVTLSLYCSRSISGPVPVTLHRLTADWGEAGSDAVFEEGAGIQAETGDVTWGYRFFDTDAWTTPGGDFVAAASASTPVAFSGSAYTWSSPQMLADVQGWIEDSASNHGWIVIGDETLSASAKRFNSRENPNAEQRPLLTIEYEVTPPPCLGDLDGNNTVDITDLAILLSAFGGGGGPADLDSDGDVDITDLSTLLSRFGITC